MSTQVSLVQIKIGKSTMTCVSVMVDSSLPPIHPYSHGVSVAESGREASNQVGFHLRDSFTLSQWVLCSGGRIHCRKGRHLGNKVLCGLSSSHCSFGSRTWGLLWALLLSIVLNLWLRWALDLGLLMFLAAILNETSLLFADRGRDKHEPENQWQCLAGEYGTKCVELRVDRSRN
jgi:hypothetical protein